MPLNAVIDEPSDTVGDRREEVDFAVQELMGAIDEQAWKEAVQATGVDETGTHCKPFELLIQACTTPVELLVDERESDDSGSITGEDVIAAARSGFEDWKRQYSHLFM